MQSQELPGSSVAAQSASDRTANRILVTSPAESESGDSPSLEVAHSPDGPLNSPTNRASEVSVISSRRPVMAQRVINSSSDCRDGLRSAPSSRNPLTVLASLNARYNRERLYDEVWTYPMRTVAPHYGVSDVALRKTCCKLHVPIPPEGYWAKLAAGKQVATRPLLPPVQVTDKRAERRGIRPHSPEEQKLILAQVARDTAMGEPVTLSCRKAGISFETYRRWCKQQ